MRAVVQRVQSASVVVEGKTVGAIDSGLLILLGVSPDDSHHSVQWMVNKVSQLRIFSDQSGRMNLSVSDVGGALLVVSQFTLYGDCRKGRRPNFMGAAKPELAEPLVEGFITAARRLGLRVESGVFGAHMDVTLCNDGPVTLILDSPSFQMS